MFNEEIRRFLANFSKSSEWRKIREVLLWKLDAPCWLIDSQGDYIVRVTQDKHYCAIMKATTARKRRCDEYYQELQDEMYKSGVPVVRTCHAGFLGFQSPIAVSGVVIGGLGASQIVDHERSLETYREYAERLGIMGDKFVSHIDEREAINQWLLETEVGLIALLAQTSVDLVIKEGDVYERDILLRNLVEFYKLITEKQSLILELEEKRLYQAIVEIASRSIDAEICSLMMINERTSLLEIKAAVGLSREVIEETRVKVGQGVSGYVAVSGESLLVKDITQDERFRAWYETGSPRYYTNSLISSPIKIGRKVVGVINMNNETSRRVFNERDLSLLSIIAEHASVVIEGSRAYHERARKERLEEKSREERSEEMISEAKRLQNEITNLKVHLEVAERMKEEAERVRSGLIEMERVRAEANRLREEAKTVEDSAEQERLKQEAAKLAIQAEKIEEQKQEELLKEEAEKLKAEVAKLKEEEETLRIEIERAEELIAQAEETEELKEETARLKEELERMKAEEEKLKNQVKALEKLRIRAEEAHQLRVQTEELSHLYELSKEIVQMEDPQHILEWLLTKIFPLFKYHIAAYLLLEEEKLIGEIKHAYSLEPRCINDLKERMISHWSDVDPDRKAEREITILVDERNLEGSDAVYPGEIKNLIFFPILDRGRTTGLIYVGNFTPDGFRLNADRLLPIVSSHASVAIEKARKYLETKELAEKDELTGVYNFRYFGKFFSDEFKRAKRYDKELSLLMLDFDHLKKFNDTYGHEEGNRLIKTVAQLIKESIREVDCLARFGGDEFAVAFPETGAEAALEAAERILDSLRNHDYRIREDTLHITASIGLANLRQIDARTPKELFMRADEALYQAKQRGRNQVYCYGKE